MISLIILVTSTSLYVPQALEKIVSAWPADFPAAVVVVQHIAADFAGSLAQWLQEHSRLEVRPVVHGDSPRLGAVLVAATNDHLVMGGDRRLVYRAEPVGTPYRPSVDVLFDSLADNLGSPVRGGRPDRNRSRRSARTLEASPTWLAHDIPG